MIKTFLNEINYIFKKPLRIVAFLVMLFIPFVYGFLYMNAYWAPFSQVDKLDIVVVNLDAKTATKDSSAEKLEATLLAKKTYSIGDNYITTSSATSIYTSENEVKESINSGKHAAAIVIPKGYTIAQDAMLSEFASKADAIVQDPISELSSIYKNHFGNDGDPNVVFMNSYKHNYLSGEMTNFVYGLTRLSLDAITSGLASTLVPPEVTGAIKDALAKIANSNIITYNNIGGDEINTYGKGMSPYFISIALWAGALVMVFVIKNERHKASEHIGTFKHYFGKTLVWFLAGWVQTTILITAVTLQGVNLGVDRQWQLYLMAYLMSTIFSLIVQAVAYSFRYGDLGEFAVVIILVLQLTSSSGTFPVEMQHSIFKVIHPIVPFTYSIDAFRELLFEPSTVDILKDIGWLLIFPVVLIPFSLFFNWRFDKKTVKWNKGIQIYRSYEIHMGDL